MSHEALNPEQFKGVPLYHGTSKSNAESILKHGFRSTWHGNYTLTPDAATARDYSFNGWSPQEGGAVLKVQVPPHEHHAYFGHDLPKEDAPEGEAERTDGSAWVRRDIPSHYISRHT